jgi:DNA-binding HxlR family transcriptional regulator
MSEGLTAKAPAATPAPIRRRSPRYSRVSGVVNIRLTEDDIRILRAVHSHRFLRSTHIERLLPWRSSKHLQYRLFGLFHNGYLDRKKEEVPAGVNPPMIYALGDRGAEVLGVGRNGVNWQEKNQSYGNRQLKHAMLVTDVRVALAWGCFNNKIRLLSPEHILSESPEATQQLAKPFQWRISVSRPGAVTLRETVRPDFIFGLEFPHHPRQPGTKRYVMLEADRGTEPQRRAEPKGPYAYRRLESIADKLFLYNQSLACWREGREVKPFGFTNFYVLIVTDRGPKRVANMVAESKRTSGGKGVWSHWFADRETLEENDFLTMPWVNGKGETVRIADWLVRNPNGS